MSSDVAIAEPFRGHARNRALSHVWSRIGARTLIYVALMVWTFIALFPLYWTLSTSFKLGRDVTQAHMIPWLDFMPSWKGWQSLGLSPDSIFQSWQSRDEFIKRFVNSIVATLGASTLALDRKSVV